MDQNRGDRRGQRGDEVVIATVFSAIALEAFINELPDVAKAGLGNPALAEDEPARKTLEALASVPKEAEASNGSIRLKYLIAHYVLSGEHWDKGKEPYQNFALLIDLRNAIVHPKPEDRVKVEETCFEVVAPRIVKKLEGKSVLVPIDDQPPLVPLLDRINTVAMGQWVCNVAADTSQLIANRFPDCALKSWIKDRAFERVS